MNVVLRAAAAYWILLFVIRLLGRRTSSQLEPFDLVVLFLVAGATISGVLGNERSLTAAVSAMVTFALMHRLVAWLKARFRPSGGSSMARRSSSTRTGHSRNNACAG